MLVVVSVVVLSVTLEVLDTIMVSEVDVELLIEVEDGCTELEVVLAFNDGEITDSALVDVLSICVCELTNVDESDEDMELIVE